ncbi:MAG: hypothetical protein HC835_15385 [Oscillatoriales cyanobacterium RM2_1_1]|nr:hypothetical protein [Oscillatoriales cyanobacterium SM2_3_0]NJO46887.1 hypothetical protein [Oscillatoriales cyanobacterium RM2_1_1]
MIGLSRSFISVGVPQYCGISLAGSRQIHRRVDADLLPPPSTEFLQQNSSKATALRQALLNAILN